MLARVPMEGWAYSRAQSNPVSAMLSWSQCLSVQEQARRQKKMGDGDRMRTRSAGAQAGILSKKREVTQTQGSGANRSRLIKGNQGRNEAAQLTPTGMGRTAGMGLGSRGGVSMGVSRAARMILRQLGHAEPSLFQTLNFQKDD